MVHDLSMEIVTLKWLIYLHIILQVNRPITRCLTNGNKFSAHKTDVKCGDPKHQYWDSNIVATRRSLPGLDIRLDETPLN